MSSLPLDNLPLFKATESTPIKSAPADVGGDRGQDFHDHLQRAAGDDPAAAPARITSQPSKESDKRQSDLVQPASEDSEQQNDQNGVATTETTAADPSDESIDQPSLDVAVALSLEVLPAIEIATETAAVEPVAHTAAIQVTSPSAELESGVQVQPLTPPIEQDQVLSAATESATEAAALDAEITPEPVPIADPTTTVEPADSQGGTKRDKRDEAHPGPQNSTEIARPLDEQAPAEGPSRDSGSSINARGPDETSTSKAATDEPAAPTKSVPQPSVPAGPTTSGRSPLDWLSSPPATSTETGQISTGERARLIQRVSRAFQFAEQRGEPVRIRLSPPELGSMRLEVSLDGKVMVARFETETRQARTILLESLPALVERLSERGIQVDQFDVDLMEREPEQLPEQRDARDAEESSDNDKKDHPTRDGSVATDDELTKLPPYHAGGNGQLNVIV